MVKRLFLLFLGATISAVGIASIANSGLGLFGITAAYLGLVKVTGLPLAIITTIVEGLMLVYVCLKGKGIGLGAIVSCSYVSVMIDMFMVLLPHHWSMVLLGPLTMFGWAIMALANMGEQASNMLTTVIVEQTGWSIAVARTIIEVGYYIVAIITAWEHLSILTLILMFGTGKLLSMFYKLFKYDPTKVSHSYLIKLKSR